MNLVTILNLMGGQLCMGSNGIPAYNVTNYKGQQMCDSTCKIHDSNGTCPPLPQDAYRNFCSASGAQHTLIYDTVCTHGEPKYHETSYTLCPKQMMENYKADYPDLYSHYGPIFDYSCIK